METGNWNVNVVMGRMPQKVATAMAKLEESITGAEYEPIAYIGSQVVNGTNHAILAKQIIVTGRDTSNVVLMIFNEKPSDTEATLIGIERIIESGLPAGGVQIDIHTEIPEDAIEIWKDAFMGYVGLAIEPFALLGTQIVNGINYLFAAEATPVGLEAGKRAYLVVVNSNERRVNLINLLTDKHQAGLSYAFTW